MSIEPGRRYSHFRILSVIEESSGGALYQARDENLDRSVALRILPAASVAGEGDRRRFLEEARSAASISHPNLATVYEVGEDGGDIFVATEWLEGETLRSRLKGRPLSIAELIRFGTGIAAGLARAHQAGVIHRRFGPEDVVIGPDDQVRVRGFGRTGAGKDWGKSGGGGESGADTATEESCPGGGVDNPGYLSPEQIRGEEADNRSDIFAFGVTLYEMATGKVPFRGSSPAETASKILHEETVPPSKINRRIPAALESILDRCLSKDPGERYTSAVEVIADLKRLGLISEDRPGVATGGIFRRRRTGPGRILWPAAGLVLAALLVTAGWMGREKLGEILREEPTGRALSPDRIAVLPFSYTGDEEYRFLEEGMVQLLSYRLDMAGSLRSVDQRALLSLAARTPVGSSVNDRLERARSLAREMGAGKFLLGDIRESGGSLDIRVGLYQTTGSDQPAERMTETGNAQAVDSLADAIATTIVTSLTGESQEMVSTESYEALKAFLTGEKAMREGKATLARESFQKAVEADPGFALAHWRLGMALLFESMDWGSAGKAWTKAEQNLDRLPRAQGRILEALLARWTERDFKTTVDMLREVTEEYPDNIEAQLWKSDALHHAGEHLGLWQEEIRSGYDRVLFYDPDNILSLHHGFWLVVPDGNREEILSLARRLGDRELGMMDFGFSVLVDLVGNGAGGPKCRLDDVRDKADFPLFASTMPLTFLGEFECADRIARYLIDSDRAERTRRRGRGISIAILRNTGHWREAWEAWVAAEEEFRLPPRRAILARAQMALSPSLPIPKSNLEEIRQDLLNWEPESEPDRYQRNVFLGLVNSRLGDWAAAGEFLAELEAQADRADTGGQEFLARGIRLAVPYLRAHLAWQQGDLDRALAEIESVRPEDLAFYSGDDASAKVLRYLRAVINQESGRHQDALRWYDTLDRGWLNSMIFTAPKHLHMGEIHDALGNTDQAILHYSRFVELWKDCDPEFRPLVEKASARLDQLREGA